MLAVRVYLWWAGGCKRGNVAQACVDEQGATVRLVDHSGMGSLWAGSAGTVTWASTLCTCFEGIGVRVCWLAFV